MNLVKIDTVSFQEYDVTIISDTFTNMKVNT